MINTILSDHLKMTPEKCKREKTAFKKKSEFGHIKIDLKGPKNQFIITDSAERSSALLHECVDDN